MRIIIFLCLCLSMMDAHSQSNEANLPIVSIRLSFLVFPPITPLLTFEMLTFEKLTVQLETNFINTHGINLKYFMKESMNGHFIFIGSAFLESSFLRKDENTTYLPYIGYGYAHRFDKSNAWTFDSRIGIGATANADNNLILPVLKTGIGRTF
jgi:hypothetical protein